MKEETICQIKRQFYAVNSKLSPLKKFTNFPLRHDKPVPLGQRILQIQILKPRIAKGGVVLPKELRLHEGLFILKFWIVGIGFALGLGDHSLMDLAVFALENEEVRCVHPHILPGTGASFVALDLKLRHGPVAVVVDLQSQTLDFRTAEYSEDGGAEEYTLIMPGYRQTMRFSDGICTGLRWEYWEFSGALDRMQGL